MKNNRDMQRYQQFLKNFRNEDSSIEDDPVARTVRDKARKVAHAWGWGDWAKDFEHETLIKLAKGEYRGEGSLDGYIAHILGNEVKLLWRKEGGDRRTEMPDDPKESNDFASEIESRLSDRTKRLMARSPKHLWWFIEAIVGADGYLSERDAAMKGKITRHKVVTLKEELRWIWENMESETEPTEQTKASAGSEPTSRAKARTAGD
jgi:hypothetical protein